MTYYILKGLKQCCYMASTIVLILQHFYSASGAMDEGGNRGYLWENYDVK